MNKKKKSVFRCRHCGHAWDELYLAELCFKIDMDNLAKTKEEMNHGKNKTYRKK